MANIFDYFINRERLNQQPQKPQSGRITLEPYQQRPVPTQFRDINGMLNQPTAEERINLEQPPNETAYQPNPISLQVDGYPSDYPSEVQTQFVDLRQPLPMPAQPNVADDRPILTTRTASDNLEDSRLRLDALQNPNNPDFQPVVNKDRGFWGRLKDVGREAIIGAGQMYRETGNLESALGGGIAGGLGGGFRPTLNEERQRMADINQERIRLGEYQDQVGAEQQRALRNAQTNAAIEEPILKRYKVDVTRLKNEADAQYKNEVIALGKRKADELKIFRDAQIELKARGADQYDVRLKQLESAMEEAKRRNTEAEKDKDLDREARITVANIMASAQKYGVDSRANTAAMQEQGRNRRFEATITKGKEEFAQLMQLRQKAQQEKNDNEVKRIDALVQAGRAKAKSAGMNDEDIKAIFGDN